MNRSLRWLSFLALSAAMLCTSPAQAQQTKPGKLLVYVGTYTGPKSKGIYRYQLDLATGAMTPVGEPTESPNPSFLALAPNHRFLYAANEVGEFEGKKTGAVTAFAIDPATGALTQLNQQSSEGSGPCHLVVDEAGKNVLVANYGGGSIAALPIQEDGRLSPASSAIQHKGPGKTERQKGPHAHSINLDAKNRFAFAADLGLDQVLVYKFDYNQGKLTPNDPPAAELSARSGPRHFAFHPSGKNAYVINEMKNTVTAFSYDADKGVLKEIQTISTLPEDFKGQSHTAEVQVHPSGKFLYGSNRGHDSLAIFAIEDDGKLKAVGHQPTGKAPRNFGCDPTGAYVLAAGQNSNSILVFKVDPQTGLLTQVGEPVEVSSPVCVKFMPMK